MAGLIDNNDSLEEDRSLLRTDLFNIENLIFPNHNVANLASSLPADQSLPRTTAPQAAAITSPPHFLDLRQTNPQDCSNLITASVNRATVEISRTIIALNATFSQQLQQASISASNGIKSAQSSATSTIQIVVLSASSVTSSAFSSLTIANLAVTSANFAVTSISSASSSDVSTLSSSLSELQASLTSVQSSASAAIAAAQSALAFATGSAAAQASSILASAASATQGSTSVAPKLPAPQLTSKISLTPAQAAAIVAAAIILTILLSFLTYFLVTKMKKRKERDSYLDEKDVASSPKKLPSRLSSAFRTGNAMTVKFNPPKSSDALPPPKSALRVPEEVYEPASSSNGKEISGASTSQINLHRNSASSTNSDPPSWPLTFTSTNTTDITSVKPLSPGFTFWPLKDDAPSSPPKLLERRKEPPTLNLLDTVKTDATIPYTSPALKESFDDYDIYSAQEAPGKVEQRIDKVSSLWEQTHQRRETPDEVVFNSFEDVKDASVSQQDENTDDFEHEQKPEIAEPSVEQSVALGMPDRLDRGSYSETAQFFRTLDSRVQQEILSDSFEDTALEPKEEPQEEVSSGINSIPRIEPQNEEWSFHKLLPQQPARVPKAETLALLQREDQARSSTVPEIDKLLRIVAQDNERLADKPLFWSDFRPVEEDVEVAMEMPPVREHEVMENVATLRETLLPMEEGDGSGNSERRDTTLSPFLMHPASQATRMSPKLEPCTGLVEEASSPRPIVFTEERENSPLRMNQIRNITSMLAEHETLPTPTALETDEAEPDERQARGRSMLRTSDIISARLSSILQAKDTTNSTVEELTADERAQTLSPLRRNPVDLTNLSDQRNRTLSPLQRNPSTSTSTPTTSIKRKPRTLSPPALPRPNPNLSSREPSPLRRNPPSTFTFPSLPNSDHSRPQSNTAFSQTLARFQSLAEKSTVNGRQASTEVTQRAIAGIFIPGSLREQAVRAESRSRERERGMGRSASSGGGL
ncbi:hypothetical protein L207DRAFT_574550 [Hyaloscypha variabilis F]|uniref:Uncharacterized protein n=1 Tax=Hyaloscypha variabilis (strain UAMH 11265 / GT02V1 / F) TaxID=1149755 RepID=A0A2J6QRZ2_HYAVF|nr:hypothetical protein L207DRAFT_574550 [Hyaloscypha variabilis F]